MKMEHLHVDKILGRIGNGCTEPLNAVLNSGQHVISKTYNNIQGNLVLVNEYISFRICRKLDLPIPDAGIALIDEQTEYNENDISEKNYGFCFYSVRIDKVAPVNLAIIPRISNKGDFYKLILFDHLVYNKDRNRGNLLVTSGKTIQMYAIDHTHVFKNQTIWNKNCLETGMTLNDYKDHEIIDSNKQVYGFFWEYLNKDYDILLQTAHEFQTKLKSQDLDEFINELPESWSISDDDTAALKKYIMYRLKHLDSICTVITGR